MYYSIEYSSPVGLLTLTSDEEHLMGLWIAGQKYFQASLAKVKKEDIQMLGEYRAVSGNASLCFSDADTNTPRVVPGSNADTPQRVPGTSVARTPTSASGPAPLPPIFLQTIQWLDRYFAGKQPSPDELSLAPMGSPFRQAVWKHLCQIPYGETTTYGAIARTMAAEMGRASMSAQAVGGAVGHNPISIIIPCHRVLGSDGGLIGYAGGLAVKQWLLELESKNECNGKTT